MTPEVPSGVLTPSYSVCASIIVFFGERESFDEAVLASHIFTAEIKQYLQEQMDLSDDKPLTYLNVRQLYW